MHLKVEYLLHPFEIIRAKKYANLFRSENYRNIVLNNPQKAIDLQWKAYYGHNMNWIEPRNLDEKIQWLSGLTDTTLWTKCSDKYEVKKYIEEKGLKNILIKTYGVWDNVDDIDYNSLPQKFVIKCTHDSGSTYIISNKDKELNIAELNKKLNRHLKEPFGYVSCEPHYLKIKPRIIAEELLEDPIGNIYSSSLIDYKIWCFNGKPYFGFICYNRHRESNGHIGVTYDIFDLNEWKPMRECLSEKYSHQNFKDIPEPSNLKQMITIAEKLSEDFPEVRVDLYNINGKIYFGELTFTSMCGRNEFYSPQTLIEMGSAIDLSNIKRIR
jgi:hypothetical protein